jgi:hypothetical protein
MPETDALELFGAPRVRGSERISVTRHVDRTWRIALRTIHLGEIFDFSRGESSASGSVLLSFERPARRRRSEGFGPWSLSGAPPPCGP